ncbi:hypothetical protein DFR30_2466 [Thiogranum longum]|uniref:Arginine N-succinyltransferase n=1 Tax=Thiogranum longum TaxID=1537524 RepID=A0A4R1HIB7_9GAMM|nr:arginine N-succinyltransferase [Thiogranum longum]TCK19169.1 hypothetical protein DFR30_2466 [Thiogranum longum]
MNEAPTTPEDKKGRFDWLHVSLLVLLTILVTVIATVWVVKVYLFPSEFKPVTLSQKEEQVLERKLDWLGGFSSSRKNTTDIPPESALPPLKPEAYSEEGTKREVHFSEKEINALLAKNTDLAHKLAIDLSDDLVSAKLLIPVDPDFPVLGGKIIRARAGVEMAYQNRRPVVVLKGISIMGVPLPNAWMGGIKNVDLINEFGEDKGFWKAFADGIDYIDVEDGKLTVKLKE